MTPPPGGDWLAEQLNGLCRTGKTTDLTTFELVCSLNEVDLSRYTRTSPGWQGRLRMTGRNLLVKRVVTSTYLVLPDEKKGSVRRRAPKAWREAQRIAKPKAKATKVEKATKALTKATKKLAEAAANAS